MKTKIFIFFCIPILLFSSCSVTKHTLFTIDDCPNPQTKFIVEKNHEEIWDNIIDFFSSENLSIKTIERVSGIIYSAPTQFSSTYWFPKTQTLGDASAYIAVQYRSDYKKDGTGITAIASWNIRVKKINDNTTEVSINIADPNISAMTYIGNGRALPVASGLKAKSTGVFEKNLLEYLMNN